MKGFIEVHDFNDGKEELINVEMIVSIKTTEEESTLLKATAYQNFNVRESYEEVKALIAEAQGDVDLNDYIAKNKLQDWMDTRMKSMCIPDYLVQFFVDLMDFLK